MLAQVLPRHPSDSELHRQDLFLVRLLLFCALLLTAGLGEKTFCFIQPESYAMAIPPNPVGRAVVIIAVVFTALDLGLILLRLWARRLKRVSLDMSDYLIIVAWASSPILV